MKKRSLAFLITAILLLSLLSLTAYAKSPHAHEGVTFAPIGSYTGIVTGKNGIFGAVPVKLTITGEQVSAPKGTKLIYNGETQTAVKSSEKTPYKLAAKSASTPYTLTGDLSAKDVGEYTFTATLNPGYQWDDGSTAPKTISWSIDRAPVTVTADDVLKYINEADPTFTATVKGTFGEDEIEYTVTCAAGKEAGEYVITVTGEAEQGNYIVS